VYLAQDLKHARHVALKVLKPELAAVVGAERFLAEIRTTAALQHPHVDGLSWRGLVPARTAATAARAALHIRTDPSSLKISCIS